MFRRRSGREVLDKGPATTAGGKTRRPPDAKRSAVAGWRRVELNPEGPHDPALEEGVQRHLPQGSFLSAEQPLHDLAVSPLILQKDGCDGGVIIAGALVDAARANCEGVLFLLGYKVDGDPLGHLPI